MGTDTLKRIVEKIHGMPAFTFPKIIRTTVKIAEDQRSHK
jgi:hypothetical protein